MIRTFLFLAAALLIVLAAAPSKAAPVSPSDLPEQAGLPELMRFQDGRPVVTEADWALRREELISLYSEYVYGYMPDPAGETLSYTLEADEKTGGTLLHIRVRTEDREAAFSVLVGLPSGETPEGGRPYFIEYMPWHYQNWLTKEWVDGFSENGRCALSRGYAWIQYDCAQVAMDNAFHLGAFFDLYPYRLTVPKERRGVLLAWAWGVSKIIDAMELGAARELGIDASLSLVGGVSRYGKSAAVAGAYDERIRVTIPACSGAGGTAVFRMSNQGKTYDLSSLGGPEAWPNESRNEPFDNLRGGEGYWFCGNFGLFRSPLSLPVDQHMLCALAAGKDRHLIMVTGITSEGWNNTEGQCLAFAASQPVWDLLGCGDGNNLLIHLDGHAILLSDMRMILDYCDKKLFGLLPEGFDEGLMKGGLFLKENRAVLDPLFDAFLDD